MATEHKHWAKEVVQRTKRRDDTTNSRFIQKKMNQLMASIAQASANISDLQIQLATYWEYNATEMAAQKQAQITAELTTNLIIEITGLTTTTTQVRSPTLIPNTMTASTITKVQNRDPVERLEKHILEYIHQSTLYVKKMAENRFQFAKAQMDEFKALEDFEQIATPSQWNIHLMLKPKVKLCSTKNKNYLIATKRIEYGLPPKFINKMDFVFKIDESIVNKDEMQIMYNQMRQTIKDFHTQAMTLYVQSLAREHELLTNEIKRIIEGFPNENDDGFDAEAGYAAFRQYHQLREKRFNLEVNQSIYFLVEQRKVSPGRPVEQFIAELDVLFQNLHNIPSTKKQIQFNKTQTNKSFDTLSSIIQSSQPSQSQVIIRPRKKKNYGRIVKRLKYKIHLANTILRKTDKSKVFHLGKVDHYQKKSEEYMDNTKAYQCLGTIDPLPDLIQRTNKYLLDLRLAKWITQKQYEQLSVKPNEVELAHLYYLPKAHKPGTPLRPIISGLKHATNKISKFLDDLLRPLFDQMALNTTVTSGFDLVKQLQQWSRNNFRQDTIFCTIDVTDLYTMVPQIEGVLSLRKMLDQLKLKQLIKLEIVVDFVSDIFITINWPVRHSLKEVDRWNKFDENINLSANIGSTVNFLDLNMENQDGQLFAMVYQKSSYEPYYLP
ncbi:unnamed protein product, partial [Rotaria magnacalcarata]